MATKLAWKWHPLKPCMAEDVEPSKLSKARERGIFGPDLVIEVEGKDRVIKKNLEEAQARQKRYHDKRRKPLWFEVGGHVCLKFSPTKDVQRFGIKGKLAPHYAGPYEIIEVCSGLTSLGCHLRYMWYTLSSTCLCWRSAFEYRQKFWLSQKWK